VRILCIGNRYPPWSLGGYEVVWEAAVAMLRERGHDARVLTTLPDPSDQPAPAPPPSSAYRELRWYWRDHEFPPLSPAEVLRLERHNARVLSRHLAEQDPEVVLWWAMGGMSLSLIDQVRRAGVPAAGLVGDAWMVYGPGVDAWSARWRRWPAPLVRMAERLSGVPARPELSRAGLWLFNSRYLLAQARDAGWELPQASILPPGVDPDRFAGRAAGQWSWRLLYCGRLDPRKGVATAIEALELLPPEARLTIHGEGSASYTHDLHALTERLGLSARVSFSHGDHTGVPAVYAAADAVVFPVTWQEPWGLVPLEAMASGRPLVASRSGGGPAEYLAEDVNCLQFEPGDADGLAAALRRLAADPGLRERLTRAGTDTAAVYTEARFHDGILAAIAEATAIRG
jgi:glycogen synthase